MKTLSIIIWLIFAGFTIYWLVRFFKAKKVYNFWLASGVEMKEEDKTHYNELNKIAVSVFAVFTLTTIIDALICIF